MNDTLLEWDGQSKHALFILGASNRSDVTCERIKQEISAHLKTISEIKNTANSTLERPVPRAGEMVRLQDEVQDFKKLATEKGCPTDSIEFEHHSES